LAFAQGPLLQWEIRRKLAFLTNQLVLPALTVTRLYKMRREVELFFRRIKQHLRIKHFYGNGANAVKFPPQENRSHINYARVTVFKGFC